MQAHTAYLYFLEQGLVQGWNNDVNFHCLHPHEKHWKVKTCVEYQKTIISI